MFLLSLNNLECSGNLFGLFTIAFWVCFAFVLYTMMCGQEEIKQNLRLEVLIQIKTVWL